MNINRDIMSLSEELQENYSSVNVVKFYDELSKYPDDILFENVGYIVGEPTMGVEFMLGVSGRCCPNAQEVNEHLLEVKKVIEEYNEVENNDMVLALENYSTLLELFNKESEVTKESMILDLTRDKIPPVNESILKVFLKPIVESLYGNETSINKFYNSDNLRNSSDDVITSVFPHIVNLCRKVMISSLGKMRERINSNKSEHPGCIHPQTSAVYDCTGVITTLTRCLIATGEISFNQAKSLADILGKEINFIQEEIACKFVNADDDETEPMRDVIKSYLCALTNSRQDLIILSKKKNLINDNVMSMQPQVGANPDTDKFEEEEIATEALIDPDLLMESVGDEEEDIIIYSQSQMESMELDAQTTIIQFATCESISDEELINTFKNMIESCTRFSYVTESSIALEGEMIRKASLGVQKGVRKVQNTVRKSSGNLKRSVEPIRKAAKSVSDQFERTVDKIKQMDMAERREKIIKGGLRANLKRIIRAGVVTGAVYAVGGWWYSAVALVGQIFADKRLDYRIKKEVVDEIDNNMKLLDEKIEDAKSDSDKQAKYQLMRQKAALEKESKRIRYNLPNTHYRNAEIVDTKQ